MCKKLCVFLLVCAVATSVGAAELQWFGGAHDRDWFNTANWGPAGGPAPGPNDKAKLNYVWANPGPIINNGAAVAGEIFVSEDLDLGTIGQQTLTVGAGGSLTTGSVGDIPYDGQILLGYFAPGTVAGHPGNDGKLLVTGGTVTIGGHFWVGFGGHGELEMTGGLIDATQPRMFAPGWNGGTATINLDGGVLHTEQWWGGVSQAWLDTHNYTFNITGGEWILNHFWVPQIQSLAAKDWITGYGSGSNVVVTWDAVLEQTHVTAIPEPATMILLGIGGLLIRRRRA